MALKAVGRSTRPLLWRVWDRRCWCLRSFLSSSLYPVQDSSPHCCPHSSPHRCPHSSPHCCPHSSPHCCLQSPLWKCSHSTWVMLSVVKSAMESNPYPHRWVSSGSLTGLSIRASLWPQAVWFQSLPPNHLIAKRLSQIEKKKKRHARFKSPGFKFHLYHLYSTTNKFCPTSLLCCCAFPVKDHNTL